MLEIASDIFNLTYYLVLGALFYIFVWERTIKMYYIYWFYRRQGIPCTGFPLPVIGTMHLFLKSIKSMDQYSKTPLEKYFSDHFGEHLPPVFLDFKEHGGSLVVTDHRYVDELYLGKNKFFDKAAKERRVYFMWFGNSIFYAASGT